MDHRLTYRGQSRDGTGKTGDATGESPAGLAERLYRAGFRWLVIERSGAQVGGISREGRVWWGEGR
jgi:hypothetical protein